MAETLLAILLVTTSAKGSSIVYRWPPSPVASPRFGRAKPDSEPSSLHLDNPWRASHPSETPKNPLKESPPLPSDPEREWKRPSTQRDRSMSFSSSGSHHSSGQNSPTKDILESHSIEDEYNHLFGYSSEFLANLLCPQRSMCHQKFELLVDDLAFIGHPVSAEDDGAWRFKPEKLKRFHFVMVLDVPDPSSSASGNITKYFDIIYEQIAFPVAAVLFQEQVLSNFVEEECDMLGSLKDDCSAKGQEFSSYMTMALEASSIAPAMKTLYEALKSSSVAYITIHDLHLELQLPPYLDVLLHSEEENETECMAAPDDDDYQVWGQEMSFGYRLPSLTAWKSLLLLDDGPEGADPYANLRRSLIGTGDRSLVEGLIKFLDIASVTLSLADMASLLDWDLETQVFPTVRWLVHHRRAKVVDIVHVGLKTVFTLPPKFNAPLSQLTAEFNQQFGQSGVPPLPRLLSTISTSSSKQSDTHFFASVVQTKDAIPLYHDVVLWMLKRDMLITLHLHIRIVATVRLKERVKIAAKGRSRDRKGSGRKGQSKLRNQLDTDADQPSLSVPWLSLSPKSSRRFPRDQSAGGSRNSRLSELILHDDSDSEGRRLEESETPESQEELDHGNEDSDEASMINDPGRATPLQRRWLSAMSDGKDPALARRFEQISQYFDGRRTDDEILYRAEMSRRELREILHHYDEYLQTFLHPSGLLGPMLSYALSTASTYFHLPVDEQEDKDISEYQRKYITWTANSAPSTSSTSPTQSSPPSSSASPERTKALNEVLSNDDLYAILGVSKSDNLDKLTLRRAYLTRSKACHPDKFPNNPDATYAFQKIAVAYSVLSQPASKRSYDTRSPFSKYDAFSANPTHADNTFRSIVLSVFDDFLEGDLEMIRSLLKSITEINPSLSMGDEGINSVLNSLQRLRERALTCRTCIYALHAELTRLLELQHSFRQLSYFDLLGRTRITIQLTRVTLSLPIALEKAIVEQNMNYGHNSDADAQTANHNADAILPRQVTLLIRGVDVVLEHMEGMLKKK
ncbi:hypothetical protein MSAN_00389300 [Mycena sanguinolenta]|uniref:Nitrogen permease regulator 3 n=1 Tax=Mycena sanguinolenta TaxID=230812 RepID=A0A8H6ZCC0_9AGAR|nr:hypothetical protein MSAN_00389300 [Mycena sanguinolenta]